VASADVEAHSNRETSSFAAHPVAANYAQYVNPAFIELLDIFGYGRVFTRARDVWLWDDQGRQYLDLLSGFGANNLGHNHPLLAQRLQVFLADEALNLYHVGPSPYAGDLAQALLAHLPAAFGICLFSNGGAEAVEAALKVARAATGRPGIVYCTGGYHGTSFGTLSVMGERRMRDPFEPLLPWCTRIPFGDLSALEEALRRGNVAAFIAEPIQAEAGVRIAPMGHWAQAKKICERHGALLIFDEIQTGLGRTAKWFAFEEEDVVPDVLVLAKSLGGGIVPIGATLLGRKLHAKAYGARERFDLHSSTFGGNSFACVAALETLRILDDEQLVENASARGGELLNGLRERLAGHPLIVDIRGRGLLVGIELGPTPHGWLNKLAPALVSIAAEKVVGQWIALRLLEAGMICQPAAHAWNVLKIEPPLTITAAQIAQIIDVIGAIFGEYRALPKLIAHVTARISRRGLARL
jgi:putrescine aminotransferase